MAEQEELEEGNKPKIGAKMASKSEDEAKKILDQWIKENELDLYEVDDTKTKETRRTENGEEVVVIETLVEGKKRVDTGLYQRMQHGIESGRISFDGPKVEISLKKPITHKENGEDKTVETVILDPDRATPKALREIRKMLGSGKSLDDLLLIGTFCKLPEPALACLRSRVDQENCAVAAAYLVFY